MLNRSLQVKVVKDRKNVTPEDDSVEMPTIDYDKIGELLEQSSKTFRDHVEDIGTKIVIGVVVYVGVDTLRQVIVKLTPTK